MSAPPGHKHISERQSGPWIDCIWQSAVEWLRQVHDPTIPATHAEGDALRAASGDTGFSNFDDLDRGTKARYGWSLPALVPPGALWATLAPGTAAVVIGNTGAWPPSSHWRRWSPGSVVNHAVFVYRFDGSNFVWWCDPLAPPGAYNGEPMPKAELLRFVAAAGAAQLVAPILEVPVAVVVLTPLLPVRTFRVAATARGFRPDSPSPVKSAQFATAHADATAVISQTPASLVPHGSFVRAFDGPLAGLYIPAGEVTLDPAPPSADCTAAARQAWNDARQAAANAAGPALLAAVPAK